MIGTNRCPRAEDLERFLLGEMADSESERLELHLSECAHCVTTVQGLKASDTLVDALRVGARRAGSIETGADDALIARLCRLRRMSAVSAGEEETKKNEARSAAEMPPGADAATARVDTQEAYELLAPAQGPGEIGRLGPYRVVKVLGAGGMGVVFLAEDPSLKRLVAVKVMKPALAAERSEIRQRFQREAEAAAAVKHDHIKGGCRSPRCSASAERSRMAWRRPTPTA